ncbi:MAG: type II secretion system F family protein [Vicinamibacterales bacterium]
MLLPWVTFVGVLVLVLGGYWLLVVRPEGETEVAVRRRLDRSTMVDAMALVKPDVVLAEEHLSSVPLVDRVLQRRAGATLALRAFLDSAGVEDSVGRFVLGSAFAGALGFVTVWVATEMASIALAAAVVAGAIPTLYVKAKRSRRMRLFEEQFPEAIDLIARAMRGGHAFATGLSMVAEEVPAPVGTEFRLLHDWQNYGMAMPEALRRFAERVPILDARFFVTSVLVQRETGGNLSEVLDNLSRVIRERFRVKRQVRVVSAHGRITGVVLSLFPMFLAVMFYSMSPDHMKVMVTDPLGIRMVIGAAVLQVVGGLIIRKLVDIEY